MSLRASQSILRNTVDGRNPAHHLGCVKPCQCWDKFFCHLWVDRCRISSNSMTIFIYTYIYCMWYVYDGSGSQSPWQCWNESTVSERFRPLSMGFGPQVDSDLPLSVLASPCFLLFGLTRWGLSTNHLCCFRSANAKTGGLGPGGLDSFWDPLMKGIERQLLLGGAPSKPQITNPSHQFTPPKTNRWFRTKPLRNE